MSSNLYWRPVKQYGGILPDELKHVLKNADEWSDSIDGEWTKASLPYLRGLRDGGVKGADKLIKLIEKHGTIELREEY